MDNEQVISINNLVWTNYIRRKSKLSLEKGFLLFPNILLITEVEDFFIVELLGSTNNFNGLTVKKNKAENVNSYLYQFNYPSKTKLKPANSDEIAQNSITNIQFGSPIEEKDLQERFFFQNRWPTKLIAGNGLASNEMFDFGATNYIEFNHCCVVNKLENIYRLKSINHLHVISKQIVSSRYKKSLIQKLSVPVNSTLDLKGISYSSTPDISVDILYSQFLNVFSIQNLRETTIGDFLKINSVILKKAFKSENVIYEPDLAWIEGNPEEDESSINPDFLIKREDGYYDILDLKLPYLEKKKLTKGKRKRRSFLQIVDDAIAQLANYEDYFSFEKNKDLAKTKYDVEIKNPRLIIIIGNFYNYDDIEIQEASRKLKDNFLIMDYDTLNLKFYNRSKNLL